MSEIAERSVINAANFFEISNMITSNDKKSQELGLSILDQADYEKSVIYILCVLKETEICKSGTRLKDDYPNLYARIEETISSNKSSELENVEEFKFETVYNMCNRSNSKEGLEFILGRFTHEINQLMSSYGFEFLNYLQVKVLPKDK